MTKTKYLLIFTVSMLMFPLISKADCSYERQAELSRIAANVQLSYTYEMVNGYPEFIVNILNLTEDIYIQDNQDYQTIIGPGEKNILYKDDDMSIKFDIYSADSACYGEKIFTTYIDLPKYNIYASSDECKKYPNFKYCGMWDKNSINSNQFREELQKYTTPSEVKTETQKTKLSEILQQHKKEVIFCVVALIVLTLIIVTRKKKER